MNYIFGAKCPASFLARARTQFFHAGEPASFLVRDQSFHAGEPASFLVRDQSFHAGEPASFLARARSFHAGTAARVPSFASKGELTQIKTLSALSSYISRNFTCFLATRANVSRENINQCSYLRRFRLIYYIIRTNNLKENTWRNYKIRYKAILWYRIDFTLAAKSSFVLCTQIHEITQRGF